MDEYMHNYAKQEGFAINAHKERLGLCIRYRCIHVGQYNNFRKLPPHVTHKSKHKEAVELSITDSYNILILL